MVHVEIFAPKLAKSGPVGAPWCSTTWQQDWRLDRKNAICAFYTNISPGSILLEARIWILSLHSGSSSSCFCLQKTVWAGETRAGRKGKQKRRGDILLFEFLHLLKRGCDQFLLFTFCIFNIRLLIFAFLIWIFISSIICSYFESHSCSGWRQNGDQELCLQVKGLLCIGKLQWLLMMMIIWCLCAGVRKRSSKFWSSARLWRKAGGQIVSSPSDCVVIIIIIRLCHYHFLARTA